MIVGCASEQRKQRGEELVWATLSAMRLLAERVHPLTPPACLFGPTGRIEHHELHQALASDRMLSNALASDKPTPIAPSAVNDALVATQAEADAIFTAVDQDRSGSIRLSEFAAPMLVPRLAADMTQMQELWAVLADDPDLDTGLITEESLSSVGSHMGVEAAEVQQMLKAVGDPRKAQVTGTEFLQLFGDDVVITEFDV